MTGGETADPGIVTLDKSPERRKAHLHCVSPDDENKLCQKEDPR